MNVTITDVHKRYGDVVALDGPSFEIPTGSTFGVLGTNGAGKTTLFSLLVGHDRPDAGHIDVGGLDVTSAGHRVRERVGFLPEHSGFPAALTGREVLSVHAHIRGVPGRVNRIEACLDLVGLTDAADRRVAGYSNGMARRLGLASTLLSRPPVLVLDEPTAGLDPIGVARFHRIVERIDRETGATVVLSSHALHEVERLCDRVAILQDGQLQTVGRIDDLRRAGVGDHVTVVVHPADIERTRLLEILEGHGTVTDDGDVLSVACDHDGAFDLAATLGGEARSLVDRFEVHEPGLEAAFHEALADDDHSGTPGNESPDSAVSTL